VTDQSTLEIAATATTTGSTMTAGPAEWQSFVGGLQRRPVRSTDAGDAASVS